SEKYKKRIIQPVEFEVFEREMEKYDLGGMLKNIQLAIEYLEGRIDFKEYNSQRHLFSETIAQVRAHEEELRAQEEELKAYEKEVELKKEVFYSTYPKFK